MPIGDMFEKLGRSLKPEQPRGPNVGMTPGGPMRGPATIGAPAVPRSEDVYVPQSRIGGAFKSLTSGKEDREQPSWATQRDMPTTARGANEERANRQVETIQNRVANGSLSRANAIVQMRRLLNEHMQHPRARQWLADTRAWQDLEDQAASNRPRRIEITEGGRNIAAAANRVRQSDVDFYRDMLGNSELSPDTRAEAEWQLHQAYQQAGRFREADELRAQMEQRNKDSYKPEILDDTARMSELSKSGYHIKIRRGGELEGLARYGVYQFDIHNKEGARVGNIEATIDPRHPDKLYIDTIAARKQADRGSYVSLGAGQKGALGMSGMRDVERQLKAVFPNAKRVGGYRVSGARTKSGKGAASADVTLMEGLLTLFGAGAATGVALTSSPDQAEAAGVPFGARLRIGALLDPAVRGKSGFRLHYDDQIGAGLHQFKIHNPDGKEIGWVEAHMSPKSPGRLWIDSIGVEGGPRSVGAEGVRDILQQLRAVFPDADEIGGYRVSGAREKAGAEEKAITKLREFLIGAGMTGAAASALLAGDSDQAEAADLGKITEMYSRFDKGARSFWLKTPESGQGMYVRNAMRPAIDGEGMSKTLDIANIDFDPAERGKGNFTQYLDEIERSGKGQGFDQVHVENVLNKRLIPFLEKRGFKRDPYSFGGAPSFYKKLAVAGGVAGGAAAMGDDQAQAGELSMSRELMRTGRERYAKEHPSDTWKDIETELLTGAMATLQSMGEVAGDTPPQRPFSSILDPVAQRRLQQGLRNFLGKKEGEDFTPEDLRAWQVVTGALGVVGNASGTLASAAVHAFIDKSMPDATPDEKAGLTAFTVAALPFSIGHLPKAAARTAGRGWQITRQLTSVPIRKLMSPASVSQTAADTASIIRMRTGIGARFTEVTRGALADDPNKGVIPNLFQNFERKINAMPEPDQRALLSYIEGRTAGSPYPAHLDPTLQGAADEVKHAMEDREQRLRALPKHAQMSFIEDYISHYWEDEGKARRFAQWWQAQGARGTSAAGHMRRRTVPTIEDGISYGLKPITTNPIDISMRYVEQMDRYIAHMEVLDEMENRGMLKWMPEGSHQIPDGWSPIRGKWSQKNGMAGVAPADAARVYNRFSSLGIQGEFARPVYESTQAVGNAITALELGLSGFHAVLMNVEAPMSLAATAAAQALGSIDKLARGQLTDALKMLGGSARRAVEAGGLPLAGALIGHTLAGPPGGVAGMLLSGGLVRAARGHKLQQTYLGRSPASSSLAMRHIANLMTAAGGRAVGKGHTLREYQFSPAGSFFTQWKRMGFSGMGRSIARRIERARYMPSSTTPMPKALSRSINAMKEVGIQLGSIFETVSQPLFEVYIPKLKDGAFYDTMHAWLNANPTASLDDQLVVARKVWDSIDNRFGELVQDNIFWDKTAKQLAMLAMRSYSWNVGTIREIAGGALAAAHGPQNARITAGTKYDPRIGYVIALPVISALMGSVYYYMKNGKAPGDGTDDGLMRDLMVPRTGGRVAGVGGRGSVDERVQMPSYMRDVFGWYNDAKQEAMNKIATGPRLAGEAWTGKDWRGDPIVRPDASMKEFVQDWLDHLFFGGNPALGPITLRNLERGRERGSNISMTEQLLGLRPASAYLQDPRGLARSREHREKTEWKRKGRYERKQERRREPSYGGTFE